MSDIFLSYARTDLPRVRPLVDALSNRGWSVWWDRTIQPGQIRAQEIQAPADDACCVIVLWSWDSVVSFWVQKEAAEGLGRNVLIAALLDDVSIPPEFSGIHVANLVGWQCALPHTGFDELAQAVEGILATTALSASTSQKARAVGTPEVASTALRTERAEPFRDVKGKEVRPARPAVLAAFWKACLRLVHPRFRIGDQTEAKAAVYFWLGECGVSFRNHGISGIRSPKKRRPLAFPDTSGVLRRVSQRGQLRVLP